MLIGFVRHGITDWNVEQRTQGITDIPLNETGRSQARQLAKRLSSERWDIIYASDLSRAKETADIVAQELGLTVLTDTRLRERNYGEAEATSLEERITRWGEDWEISPKGLETEEDVSDRLIDFLNDILEQHDPDTRILIVSHGALIGITLKRLIPHVDTREHLHNTSLTKVVFQDGSWDCELYNCAKHLSDIAIED